MPALPNLLTAFRLLAAPVVAALILWADGRVFSHGAANAAGIYGWAFAIYALAAVSDALDGWLARALNAQSALGAALDHIADKALTACVLVALSAAALPADLVFAAVLIIGRDVAIAGLREGLSLSGRALPVDGSGKVKTLAVMTGVGAALLLQPLLLTTAAPQLAALLEPLARGALWGGVALALWSGAGYLAAALRPAPDTPSPRA
jgi:cardiolipin synthase (CMP-forming)